MALRGRLTKDNIGLSMPVNACAFIAKPPFWRDGIWYTFTYETDPDAAADLVPEQLTLCTPAVARLIFAEYKWSTGGPYFEVLQAIDVEHGGERCVYFTQAGVSESTALMAGREGYGFPKKMGRISFVRHEDIMGMYYERPLGIRLATAVFRELTPIDPQSLPPILRGINLRIIMSPEKDAQYSLADLVLGELEVKCKEAWMGEGNCSYSALSELDPWHRLPVRKSIECTRMNFDIDLKGARIIATF